MRQLRYFRNPWTPTVTSTPRFKRYTFPNAVFFRRRGTPMVIPRGFSYKSVKSRRAHKLYADNLKFVNNLPPVMSLADKAWLARYYEQDALMPDSCFQPRAYC